MRAATIADRVVIRIKIKDDDIPSTQEALLQSRPFLRQHTDHQWPCYVLLLVRLIPSSQPLPQEYYLSMCIGSIRNTHGNRTSGLSPASLLSGTEVKRIDIHVCSFSLGDILSPYLKVCQKYSAQNVPEGFNGTDHPACPAKALHPASSHFCLTGSADCGGHQGMWLCLALKEGIMREEVRITWCCKN